VGSSPDDLITKAPLIAKEIGDSSSEDEDFEGGENQREVKKDDIDAVDEQKFKKLVEGAVAEPVGAGFTLIDQDPLEAARHQQVED